MVGLKVTAVLQKAYPLVVGDWSSMQAFVEGLAVVVTINYQQYKIEHI